MNSYIWRNKQIWLSTSNLVKLDVLRLQSIKLDWVPNIQLVVKAATILQHLAPPHSCIFGLYG